MRLVPIVNLEIRLIRKRAASEDVEGSVVPSC